MAHRQQQLIDELVGDDKPDTDHSLQKKALDRALENRVPTTLTPWEWQDYYAAHGVPDSHQQQSPVEPRRSWWRRLLRLN